jgi:hypothetical protein
MDSRRRPRRRLLALAAAGAALAVPAPAQVASAESEPSIATLAQELDSPDYQTRSGAVGMLNLRSVAEIPPAVVDKLIALLEKEAEGEAREEERKNAAATKASDEEGEGEGYGEYLLTLAHGVVRLNDRRALHGVALGVLSTSRRAEDFVAAGGGTSLPYLDETWRRRPSMRGGVAETWAIMLGKYTDRLTPAEQRLVRARIFGVLAQDPLSFAWAAHIAQLPELLPVLQMLAASGSEEFAPDRAASVVRELTPARARLSPAALLQSLDEWLQALCLDRRGARAGACESLTKSLTDARGYVNGNLAKPAVTALTAFATRADAARAEGAISEGERRLLAGNARYVVSRLGRP